MDQGIQVLVYYRDVLYSFFTARFVGTRNIRKRALKPEKKPYGGRPRSKWKDKIKIYLKNLACIDPTQVAQGNLAPGCGE
jgi:hypothetical protein